MKETRDPAIKLFGKKIPLPSDEETSERDLGVEDGDETETENKNSNIEQQSSNDEVPDSNNANNPRTPSIDEDGPKKPDKILPCPRCKSTDTKFCYYNNYSVNQPRHLCRACQRFWTSGGATRNVPVGSGRRKAKSSSSSSPAIPQSVSILPGVPWPALYPCNWWWFPQREGRVLVPKPLRIDDPIEAAKSSIWATLGIEKDGVGMFKGFKSKSSDECEDEEMMKKKRKKDTKTSPVLMANPAALSRAIHFHETS